MHEILINDDDLEVLQRAWNDRFKKVASKEMKKNKVALLQAIQKNEELRKLFVVGSKLEWI